MYDLDFTHWDESHLADDWSTLRSQFYGESVRQKVELPAHRHVPRAARGVRAGRPRRGHRRGRRHRGGARARRSSGRCIESSKRNGEAVLLHEVIDGRPGGPERLRDSIVPVVRGADLDFAALPGRLSADPVPAGLDVGCSVRVVRIAPGPAHAAPCTRTATRSSTSSSGTRQRLGGRRADAGRGRATSSLVPAGVPHATVATGDDGPRAGLLLPAPRPRGQHRGAGRPPPQLTAVRRPAPPSW